MKAPFILLLFFPLSFIYSASCDQKASNLLQNAPDRVHNVKEAILKSLEQRNITYTDYAIRLLEGSSISKDHVKMVLERGEYLPNKDKLHREANSWTYTIAYNSSSLPGKNPILVVIELRPTYMGTNVHVITVKRPNPARKRRFRPSANRTQVRHQQYQHLPKRIRAEDYEDYD